MFFVSNDGYRVVCPFLRTISNERSLPLAEKVKAVTSYVLEISGVITTKLL